MTRGIIFCLLLCIHGVSAQCENLGGIIAGCILGTLALCIVIGAVAFLCYRKRSQKDKEKPKNKISSEHAYENPVFTSDETFRDGQDSDLEKGLPENYVECKEYESPNKNKKSSKSLTFNPEASPNKNWSSLPRSPFTTIDDGRRRGSLDDNVLAVDPEVISVALQSKDIIGLGFNICGSMRDGIYISQVHNRGPANESGMVKAGDRIMAVTISFENMVYEDALTIMSYASPYPVRIAVQKSLPHVQGTSVKRMAQSSLNLHHPLYRSQSLDDLSKMGKEPLQYKARRTYSEYHRHEPKHSSCSNGSPAPELKRWSLDRPLMEMDEGEGLKTTDIFAGGEIVECKTPHIFPGEEVVDLTDGKSSISNFSFPDMKIDSKDIFSEVSQHYDAEETNTNGNNNMQIQVEADIETPPKDFVDIELDSEAASKGNTIEVEKHVGNVESAPTSITDTQIVVSSPSPTEEKGFPAEGKSLASPFKDLSEEDRADVIRLSYEDPSSTAITEHNLETPSPDVKPTSPKKRRAPAPPVEHQHHEQEPVKTKLTIQLSEPKAEASEPEKKVTGVTIATKSPETEPEVIIPPVAVEAKPQEVVAVASVKDNESANDDERLSQNSDSQSSISSESDLGENEIQPAKLARYSNLTNLADISSLNSQDYDNDPSTGDSMESMEEDQPEEQSQLIESFAEQQEIEAPQFSSPVAGSGDASPDLDTTTGLDVSEINEKNQSLHLLSSDSQVQEFLTSETPDPNLLFHDSQVVEGEDQEASERPQTTEESSSSHSSVPASPAMEHKFEIDVEVSSHDGSVSEEDSPQYYIDHSDNDEIIRAVPAQAVLDDSEDATSRGSGSVTPVGEQEFVIDVSEQDVSGTETGLIVDQNSTSQFVIHDTSSGHGSHSDDEGNPPSSPDSQASNQFTIVINGQNGDGQSSSYDTTPEGSPTKPSHLSNFEHEHVENKEQLMNRRNVEASQGTGVVEQYGQSAFTITLNQDHENSN